MHRCGIREEDPSDISEETEKKHEYQLSSQYNGYRWSVKNQARMHLRNGDPPYGNISEAMKRWPETATAVAVTLDHNEQVRVIAPHGFDDLLGLAVRRSPFFADQPYFLTRVESKRWLQTWPKLKLFVCLIGGCRSCSPFANRWSAIVKSYRAYNIRTAAF
ncbi:nucleotidyltransferase family protein [Paenibacillus arenilitoris]|uniref:nucleotidyltransferase family protein n=1 Tax=Paenibacillus arenilitoris TaxID=2772299 RepID=UPI00295B6435|nr:nucleotidyltransferase family protein [Paenibacillus arenilitoris]